MRNLKLTISFDGTNYHGWQRQSNAITVQQTMEDTLQKITHEKTTLIGCSRTDRGVHARVYICNFKSHTKVPCIKMPIALNSLLPDDIAVVSCSDVAEDFHATLDAKQKTYIYQIYNNIHKDPFLRNYAYFHPGKISLSEMEKAAKHLIGTHDFAGFMAQGVITKNTVREIFDLQISENQNIISLKIIADGYLYNMVRIIAGTLLYAGIGKIMPDEIPSILESRDRTRAGRTLAPCGLYLTDIAY